MASNNYTSANVVPSSDTFREWVDLTNRITYDMEKVVVTTVANTQGACTSGNAYVNGFFSANTLLVEDTLKGVGATGSVYGTKAAAANLVISSNVVFIANSTANAIIHAQSNAHFTGPKVEASSNVFVNSTSSLFQSNATLNDFNSNVDIDAATVTVDGGSLTVGSNTVLNANSDINANVDIDAASVTIDGGTLAVGSILDQNANVDIDNALTDITSTTTNISGTTATIDSTTLNIHGTSLDINSATNIDGDITTTANATIGNANTDLLTVTANAVFSDKIKVTKDADLDAALNVDGDVTLNANLVIGSNNSDGANIQSLIVSSIEPSANGKVLGHADRRWVAALSTANTSGDITAGADVDITGEVNAASAAIVGGATVGGNVVVSGDIDGADNKEANVYNAVVRNDLTVTRDSVLNGNTTLNHTKNFIVGNSTIKTLQSNASGNVRVMQIGHSTTANSTFADRLIIKSTVGNSSFGLIPLAGNNVTLGNTTNRWHNASFTNANTSGTLTSTGVITASANIEAAATTNTNVLKVTTTSTMGGKLTISSDGAAITGPVDLVTSINVGANVGMTTAHMLVKGTAAVGNTIANSSVLHVGNSTVNTHISKGGIDTDGTLAVLKAATFSNTVTATGFINSATSVETAGNIKAASANVSGHTNVATLGATGAVDLDSTLTVDGLATFNGSVDLGNADSDTVSFVADVDTDILPSANGKNLGSTTARWDVAAATINSSGNATIGGGVYIGNSTVNSTVTANTTQTRLDVDYVNAANLVITGSAVLPTDTTLTASGLGAADLTITNTAIFNAAGTGDFIQFGNGTDRLDIRMANAVVNGHTLAATTNTYDIGSAGLSFRSGYFDTSVVVGDTTVDTTKVVADFLYAREDLVANYSSDQQLKDNVLKIDTALDKVNSLGGYSFTWNNNIGDMRAGTPDYGVIAQEIEDVLPHAVDINSRGHKTVNYNSLIPLLIEAVKELTERVKELEPDVEEPEIEEDVDG